MKLTKIQQAKSKLLLQQAFFATLIMSTQIEEAEHVPTAATDMVKIMYNAAWVATLEVGQVMTVLAHEVLHIVFKHGLRRHDKNLKFSHKRYDVKAFLMKFSMQSNMNAKLRLLLEQAQSVL